MATYQYVYWLPTPALRNRESWLTHVPDRKSAGLYAARVAGRPPPDVIEAIEAKGGTYRPRDEVEE